MFQPVAHEKRRWVRQAPPQAGDVRELGLKVAPGLGLAPPTPTWGGMVRDGFDNILSAFHLAIIPSIAILFLVLAFNLIGDGLRDAIDPRLKDAS